MSGLFITLDGTEGGGKSTRIARLGERLNALNFKVRSIHEPGGTPIGEEIRLALCAGDIVIGDRFSGFTVACRVTGGSSI